VFVRISFFKGTGPQLDAAIDLIRDRIDPSFRTQAGYLGAVTLIDRESGQGAAGTYWETAADMSAAEDMAVAGRGEASERAGIQLTDVDRFERILADRVGEPEQGGFARTTELRGSPDKIGAVLALAQEKGIPLLRSRTGYRAMVISANRATGRILASSIWQTAADRDATEQNLSGIRDELALAAGASSSRIIRSEIVLSTLSSAAMDAGIRARTT
jgi:hypothetical protein